MKITYVPSSSSEQPYNKLMSNTIRLLLMPLTRSATTAPAAVARNWRFTTALLNLILLPKPDVLIPPSPDADGVGIAKEIAVDDSLLLRRGVNV